MKQSSVQSNNGSLHLILIISSVIVLFFYIIDEINYENS